MTNQEMMAWIDQASYTALLCKWRFAEIGDPFFRRDVGKHYSKVMSERRSAISPEEHTAVSKRIGW